MCVYIEMSDSSIMLIFNQPCSVLVDWIGAVSAMAGFVFHRLVSCFGPCHVCCALCVAVILPFNRAAEN